MKKHNIILTTIILPLLITTSLVSPTYSAEKTKSDQIQGTSSNISQNTKQKIEIVFVLDTTGSMGGLLQGAKNKIWHIATEIQNAQTDVEVRMGLIGYRDRGDKYITKHFPITNDINGIYADLIEFRAGGGGDTPESVNQALFEAINQQNWNTDHDTLRMVFLVGDAPPKMNYQDDVKYKQTVKLAKEKNIIINTILAGGSKKTKKVWKYIAQNADGAFSQIAQDGNVSIIKTPYDDEIMQLNIQLNNTVILYGDKKVKFSATKKMRSIVNASPSASSDMATYNTKRVLKTQVFSGKGDLLQEMEAMGFSLGGAVEKNLPAKLKSMNLTERKKFVQETRTKRRDIQTKIDELAVKRAKYKTEKSKRLSSEKKNSFDMNMIKIIQNQAATKNIKY